jgi:hypothetical protein
MELDEAIFHINENLANKACLSEDPSSSIEIHKSKFSGLHLIQLSSFHSIKIFPSSVDIT